MTNYYKILGIRKDARGFDIKNSYRQKSIKYHPSRNKDLDSTKIFFSVIEGYEILSDKELRIQYNTLYDKYFLNSSNSLTVETEIEIKNKLQTAIASVREKAESLVADNAFVKQQVVDSIVADIGLEGFLLLLVGEVVKASFILGVILFLGGILVAINNPTRIIYVGVGLTFLGALLIWYRLRQIRRGEG